MRVAIVTRNARAYYRAAKVLKEYGIPFHSACPGEELPLDVEAVLTSREEYREVEFPVKVVIGENFVDELLRKLNGTGRAGRIYIAIDPGERPGVSVIADNRVLEVYHLSSPRDVETIVGLLNKYPDARIKIGHGAKRQRALMLRALGEVLGYDYPLIVVNERRTTPKVGGLDVSQVQDIVAAINIGLREGRETSIAALLNVGEPTKREIEYIKRRSRELSGNITISSRLAREVALGNLTLEEAIERQGRS
ncbi:hypothetical protein [Thermococcus sp.]|uniref:hypothetical protein n=1 Tax=Thermococcus sp. TaxID=35749 RepID=UPI0026170BAF|nr:hypothetical protein [Thermococcus sp.]